MTAQFEKRGAVGSRGSPKDVDAGGHRGFPGFHKFTKLTAQAIAAHGRPVASRQRVAHLGSREGRIEHHGARQWSRTDVAAFRANALEYRTALDTADQALSLWRPLARRFFKMARPARVLMR